MIYLFSTLAKAYKELFSNTWYTAVCTYAQVPGSEGGGGGGGK